MKKITKKIEINYIAHDITNKYHYSNSITMSETVNFAKLLLTSGSQIITICGLAMIFISVVFGLNSITGIMIGVLQILGEVGDPKTSIDYVKIFGWGNWSRFFLIFGCLISGLILRKLGNWLGSKELIESVEEFTGKAVEKGEPGRRSN